MLPNPVGLSFHFFYDPLLEIRLHIAPVLFYAVLLVHQLRRILCLSLSKFNVHNSLYSAQLR